MALILACLCPSSWPSAAITVPGLKAQPDMSRLDVARQRQNISAGLVFDRTDNWLSDLGDEGSPVESRIWVDLSIHPESFRPLIRWSVGGGGRDGIERLDQDL